MEITKKNANVNRQTSSHNEGQQGNTPPSVEGDGQRNTNNNSHAMSSMMQDSEEQKAGNKDENESENDQ